MGAPSVVFLPITGVPDCVFQPMTACVFLPMTAVTTCAMYVDCSISTYGRSDDLCRVCRVEYFYLCQAMPGCDNLYQVCRLLYFYLCQLCQVHKVLFFYLCQPVPGCDDLCRVCKVVYFYLCQAVTTCAGYEDCYNFIISTYARCYELCRVYRG